MWLSSEKSGWKISLPSNKNLVTLSLSSCTFSCRILRPYISALRLEAIAALDLSLVSDTNLAEPAVSALTFSINFFLLIKLEDWLKACACE